MYVVMYGLLLHALNTSALGVARLKARFGEHFGRTTSVVRPPIACVSRLLKLRLFSPRLSV